MTLTDLKTYKLNHTMIRVKEPKRSLEFYQEKLGMKLLYQFDCDEFNETKTMYFLGYDQPGALNKGKPVFEREGVLELAYKHGAENDDNFKVHSGNREPRGFGHISIAVDNVVAACERLENAGVKFQKTLSEGRQKDIAFSLDPDGYWVELHERSMGGNKQTQEARTTDVRSYRFNHTMIRVKDPKVSLRFYQDVFGMTLLHTFEQPSAKFTVYFLGYTFDKKVPTNDDEAKLLCTGYEGLLELTWNWGTETDDQFQGYHNGNSEPKGFGHIAISVDNIDGACKRLEEKGLSFIKKPNDGNMKNVAIVQDPDSYWIGVIPHNLQI